MFNEDRLLKIAVLPGDGIGQEVIEAALPVFSLLKIPCEFYFGEIGWKCWQASGEPIPSSTWDLLEQCDVALLGAITSKPLHEAELELPEQLRGKNHAYVSPIIQLRQKFKLFANVRPVTNVLGDRRDYRFCVIRENTEGLYAGLDFSSISPDLQKIIAQRWRENLAWEIADLDHASCAIRLQTRKATERLFRFAFQYATQNHYKQVTLADKPNVLRESGNFLFEIFQEVAKDYPELHWDMQNVDALGMRIVKHPEQLGVIVAENMFGDILSDVSAGVMGGLGLAPSANVGSMKPYFEPVHGSAPKLAGQNKANPSAMFLTISLLLRHFYFTEQATQVENAVRNTIRDGTHITYDLGGSASTQEMAEAMLSQIKNPIAKKTVGILATGTEIVSGEIVNTNSQQLAQILDENGIMVKQHYAVGDDDREIRRAIENLLGNNDVVMITGGLGPTSDDRTRFALSVVTHKKLIFDEAIWNHIVVRLQRLGVEVHENNRQQALFPTGAHTLPNSNGTAAGCWLTYNKKLVFMLPGPPSECLPIFIEQVIPILMKKDLGSTFFRKRWRLIGVVESTIAAQLDQLVKPYGLKTGFRWARPYVDFKLEFPITASVKQELRRDLIQEINEVLLPHFVTQKPMNASDLLVAALVKLDRKVWINDMATGGALQHAINVPDTKKLINVFDGQESKKASANEIELQLSGLEEFWQCKPFFGTTEVVCLVRFSSQDYQSRIVIPYRGDSVRDFAVEFACYQCLKVIGKHFPELKEELPDATI